MDEEALIKEIFSPTRLLILLELSMGEKTLTQLAKKLGLAPSTMCYHLRKLEKLGLVSVSRTVQRGNLITKYYKVAKELEVLTRNMPNKDSRKLIIPCITTFLAKALEKALRIRKSSFGAVNLLILNLDREDAAEITHQLQNLLERAKELSKKAKKGDTEMIISITALAYPQETQENQ